MGTDTWKDARAKHHRYLRREPQESVLYRVVYDYREELEHRWSEHFEHRYGALRECVLKAFDAYLDCGVLVHGCARLYCPDCQHTELLAFSCKRRGLCPSCDAKRGVVFAEHLHENILKEYPHRHAVFALPKRLRPYFRFNRKLCRILYRAAWRAWREVVCPSSDSGATGAVLSLHSAGDLINWHPHLHGLMLDGWIGEGGEFCAAPEIDIVKLESEFSNRVFNELIAEGLLEEETAIEMACWEHSGFNVWVSEPIAAEDADRRRFVGKYLKRCPISLERLELVDNGLGATIRVIKKLDDGEKVRELSPLEFLAEVSTHIPNSYEQTTRYVGCYSARTRGAEKKKSDVAPVSSEPLSLAETMEISHRSVSKDWATCIKRVYEVDPLECPKCGGQMKIIAFLHDPKVIKAISASLGIQPWRAPPKMSKQVEDDYCYDQRAE